MMMRDIANELISAMEKSTGTLVAYDSKKRREMPFSELYSEVQNTAQNLFNSGYKHGDIVGMNFSSSLETIIVDLALVSLGIKSVPVNDMANLTFFKGERAVGNKVIVSREDNACIEKCMEANIELVYIDDLRKEAEEIPFSIHSFADDEVFMYKSTSGSTGVPKIIGHLKGALNNSLENVQKLFQHKENDNILVFLPLELLQQRYWIYSAIVFNYKVTVVSKEMVFFALQMERPTVLMGIPFFFETMMNEFVSSLKDDKKKAKWEAFRKEKSGETYPEFAELFGGNIRYLWTGSAPISKACLNFYDVVGIPLLQGYGMNETCIISKNYPGKNRIGTVGTIFPNIELKLDDNNQILVKPKHPICTEYAFNSGSNDSFFDDGFFATGDIGQLDEDGYLSITGRMKDLIVLSTSKKVNPRYVEEQLEKHREIEKCVVFGDDKPYLVALIQPWDESIPKEMIRNLVDAHNERARTEERILRFHILDEKITENDRFMSNQNKIKRNEVFAEYENTINELSK